MKKRRRSRWPGLLLAVIMTVVLMTGCAGAGKEDAQENVAVLTTVTEQESLEEASGPESEDTDEEAEEASGPGSEDTDEEAEEAAGPAPEKAPSASFWKKKAPLLWTPIKSQERSWSRAARF